MKNGTVKWFNEKKGSASFNSRTDPMYSYITQRLTPADSGLSTKATRSPSMSSKVPKVRQPLTLQ